MRCYLIGMAPVLDTLFRFRISESRMGVFAIQYNQVIVIPECAIIVRFKQKYQIVV
jgi:hypothetical protein